MRSRYSAYVKDLPTYLLRTWHPSTRPSELVLDPGVRWYRLDILSRTRGGMLDNEGTVEFRASYRTGAEKGSQHELSRFVREHGQWYYLDGE
jgi:SEC-C motif-containing protein